MTLRVKLRRKPVVRPGGKPQRKAAGKLTKKRAIGLRSGLTSGGLKASKRLVGKYPAHEQARSYGRRARPLHLIDGESNRADRCRRAIDGCFFGEPSASKDENSGRNEALHMDRTHAPPSGLVPRV